MHPIKLIPVFYDSLAPGEAPELLEELVGSVLLPLVQAFDDRPRLRAVFHLSGTVLEWLRAYHPPVLERFAALARRGQVELLGGAHHGAVLHLVPERDALAQLRRHQSWVRKHLDAGARGAWLAAGAWDPTLPRLLVKAGFQYTFLDSDVLGSGGSSVRPGQSWYVAERGGATIGLFGLDRPLSSMIPWARLHVVQAELRARLRAGEEHLALAVPLERLGLSGAAREWCWVGRHGWMAGLFDFWIREAQWLQLRLGCEALDGAPPAGRAYPPSATSPEIGQEALPVDQGRAFARAWEATRRSRERSEAAAHRWLPGPRFEFFLERHDAANRLHKRMLRASNLVQSLRRRAHSASDDPGLKTALADATGALQFGLSAAPLHGAAGGALLRGEVRHAAWRALLDAEQVVSACVSKLDRLAHEVVDYDCDGVPEVVVTNPRWQAVVRPAAGGALAELNLWGHGNLVNTISRAEEIWHDQLGTPADLPALVEEVAEATVEIHDDEHTAEEETTARVEIGAEPPLLPLVPDLDRVRAVDHHRRLCVQEHFLGAGTSLRNLQMGQYPELGDFLDTPYRLASTRPAADGGLAVVLESDGTVAEGGQTHLIRMVKRYRFHHQDAMLAADIEVRNRYFEPARVRFGIEFNLNLDSRRGPDRFIQIPSRAPAPLDEAGEVLGVDRFALVLGDRGVHVRVWWSRPAHLYFFPVETPLRTPDGIVAAFQGICLVAAWDVDLWGEEKAVFDLNIRVAEV